jgi:hypothetical protein
VAEAAHPPAEPHRGRPSRQHAVGREAADQDERRRLAATVVDQDLVRLEQPLGVLVRLVVADVEQVRRRDAEPVEDGRLVGPGGPQELRADPVRDDQELLGAGAEQPLQVVRGGHRRRDDPAGAAHRPADEQPRVGEAAATQKLGEQHVDDVVDRHHHLAGVERRDDVVRDVQGADAVAHRGERHREVLLERVAARRNLDQLPVLGQLGQQVPALRRNQHDEPARLAPARELAEQPLQVRTDAEVRQLAHVDAEAAHRQEL